MRIGVPTEIKTDEYRVGMTPGAVREAVAHGHEVLMQSNAGMGIGCDDSAYIAAGASIVPDAAGVFAAAQMIVKVKEPQVAECLMLRQGQVLFTYLHLAPDPAQANALLSSGCTAIAYETITDDNGRLPLLAPMSEVAGRMSVQVGAVALHNTCGGRGVLLGGVPGVAPARVVVLGGGVVGTQAARMALGLGAQVAIFDRSLPRLRQLDEQFGGRVSCNYASMDMIDDALLEAELVVGAVLMPGATAPKIVRREHLRSMRPGSVVVDVSIDQGGCFETSHATTHAAPTFVIDGIVHYCVANMPGAVARTSTFALNHATLPFLLTLADKGWKIACRDDRHLRNGLTVHLGQITHPAVAEGLRREYADPAQWL